MVALYGTARDRHPRVERARKPKTRRGRNPCGSMVLRRGRGGPKELRNGQVSTVPVEPGRVPPRVTSYGLGNSI